MGAADGVVTSRSWLAATEESIVFTYPRRWIATVGLALTFGLFSTSAIPVVTGSTGYANAKAKSQVAKKTNRTRQS